MSQASLEIAHPYFKLKDKTSTSMWDDYEFGADKGKYSEHFDDYHRYDASDWTITTTEAGGADATEVITDAAFGVLLITNDSGAADLDQLQQVGETFLPAAGKNLWFESRFYVADVSSSSVLVGFGVTDTSLVASNPANGIFFTAASSSLNFISRASSTNSSITGIIDTTDSGYIKAGFKVIGTSRIEVWVNDVYRGAVTDNIPATEMRLSYAISNGAGAAEALGVDYVRYVMER